MKTLRDIPVGGSATVARLTGEGALKRRIMDMGLTKGTSVVVRKVAPLGDPLEITVRGYELSIRKEEAPARRGRRLNEVERSSQAPPRRWGRDYPRKEFHEHPDCPCRQPELRQDDPFQPDHR